MKHTKEKKKGTKRSRKGRSVSNTTHIPGSRNR